MSVYLNLCLFLCLPAYIKCIYIYMYMSVYCSLPDKIFAPRRSEHLFSKKNRIAKKWLMELGDQSISNRCKPLI